MCVLNRCSHRLRPSLNRSISDQTSSSSDVIVPSKKKKLQCVVCPPILAKLSKVYDSLGMHSPNVLQKRKRCYPSPKKSTCQPYRNLVQQNQWVRDNLFDAQGNYVYCKSCILECINIHSERLVHQRKIKYNLSQCPIVSMTKKDVVEQRLEKWVVASEGVDCGFKQYWKSLKDESEVLVKYPLPSWSLWQTI